MKQQLYRLKQNLKLFFVNKDLRFRKEFHEQLRLLNKKFHDGLLCNDLWAYRRCPVCEQSDFIPLFKTPANFEYKQCMNCKMVVMQPLPSNSCLDKFYNSEELSFNASGNKITNCVQPLGREDFNYILPFIDKGRLLDIGCGTGGFLHTAAEKFIPEGLEINKIHAGLGIKNGITIHNCYSGDFKPNYGFDVITLLQVFEHLPEPSSVINDAYRLLIPGGYLYVSCPNADSVSMGIFGRKHRHVSAFGHVNIYDSLTLSKQIEPLGFKALDISTYFLDIELHDLYYYYFCNKKFSHRYSAYNPFTYQLFSLLFSPFKKSLSAHYNKKKKGSYLRAIFRKV